nr:MAG TPA: hypothetical protein [Caudoviricetes sp.]DAY55857.1 MAG TPA: hypothetical protein [Caudoviricetes sp.]
MFRNASFLTIFRRTFKERLIDVDILVQHLYIVKCETHIFYKVFISVLFRQQKTAHCRTVLEGIGMFTLSLFLAY